MAVYRIARTAEEIKAEMDKLVPLIDTDHRAYAAYQALRWVVGHTDTSPADDV